MEYRDEKRYKLKLKKTKDIVSYYDQLAVRLSKSQID